MYRVKRGDNLGSIARRFGVVTNTLKSANRLRNNFLKVGQVLKVQLRGPCTQCPLPPPSAVPRRRLPPAPSVAQLPGSPVDAASCPASLDS